MELSINTITERGLLYILKIDNRVSHIRRNCRIIAFSFFILPKRQPLTLRPSDKRLGDAGGAFAVVVVQVVVDD